MRHPRTNWKGVQGAIAIGIGILLEVVAVCCHEHPGPPNAGTLCLLLLGVYDIATGAVAMVISAQEDGRI